MATKYPRFIDHVFKDVTSFEERCIKKDCLAPGDRDWLLPWRCSMHKWTLIDMWDDDDIGLVTLANAFCAYCERHGVVDFSKDIAEYRRCPNPGSADHLFYNVGFNC